MAYKIVRDMLLFYSLTTIALKAMHTTDMYVTRFLFGLGVDKEGISTNYCLSCLKASSASYVHLKSLIDPKCLKKGGHFQAEQETYLPKVVIHLSF